MLLKKTKLGPRLWKIEPYTFWGDIVPVAVLGVLFSAIVMLVISALYQHLFE